MIPENDKRVIQMRKMGYSDAQIEEMLEDDKAVDRGEIMEWDLSPEEHKKAMKYANADEHKKAVPQPIHKKAAPQPAETAKKQPTVWDWNTEGKKHKANAPKIEIMEKIFEFLSENCDLEFENLNIMEMPTQKKVEITYKGENFTLALTNHRKK